MTASATIDVQTAKNALIVPIAALSYQPAHGTGTHQHAAHATSANATNANATNANANATSADGATGAATGSSPWGATTGSASSALATGSHGRIFVLRNGKLVRVPVDLALVTTTQAAVTPQNGATLQAGDAVVTADGSNASGARPQHQAAATGNALMGAPAVRMPR
jgi:hypothetical protein